MRIYTDLAYHGKRQKKSFFEGWYLKHLVGNHVFSFIPGIAIEPSGEKKAFIQIINDFMSHVLFYDVEDFYAEEDRFFVRIGENEFSEKGISLDIDDQEAGVLFQGNIEYSPFLPIQKNRFSPSIMGPFSYLSFMECYHDILSLEHELEGEILFNGKPLDFTGGKGYIEKDWGRSFPKSWIWCQCNVFPTEDVSFFFSIADIPFKGKSFLGLICILHIRGKEYRFATYYKGHVESICKDQNHYEIVLKQGEYQLILEVWSEGGKELLAPVFGEMDRGIKETVNAQILVKLKKSSRTIFRAEGFYAGFEAVGNVQGFTY